MNMNLNTEHWKVRYRVSLKKRSFVIPAPLEALGCFKGLDTSQKHCQSFFLVERTTFNPIAHFDTILAYPGGSSRRCSKFPIPKFTDLGGKCCGSQAGSNHKYNRHTFLFQKCMVHKKKDVWQCFSLTFSPLDHPRALSGAGITKERFLETPCRINGIVNQDKFSWLNTVVKGKIHILNINRVQIMDMDMNIENREVRYVECHTYERWCYSR